MISELSLYLQNVRKYPKFTFWRFVSFFTPDFRKNARIRSIEKKTEAIVKKKGLPFLVRSKISYKDGEDYTSIGCHWPYQRQINGRYAVFVYAHYTMASKTEIMKTILHEYGHFIDYCTSEKAMAPLESNYSTKKFTNDRGDFYESFAELFAEYILDLTKIDDEFKQILDTAIDDGIENLKNCAIKSTLDEINFGRDSRIRINDQLDIRSNQKLEESHL